MPIAKIHNSLFNLMRKGIRIAIRFGGERDGKKENDNAQLFHLLLDVTFCIWARDTVSHGKRLER